MNKTISMLSEFYDFGVGDLGDILEWLWENDYLSDNGKDFSRKFLKKFKLRSFATLKKETK